MKLMGQKKTKNKTKKWRIDEKVKKKRINLRK